MGWIEKRQGKRGTSYRVGWRDPTGQAKQRTFRRAHDARDFLKDIEARLTTGNYVDPKLGDVAVADFWRHYLKTAANLRPTTRARYETHGRAYIVPELGDYRVNQVRVKDVRALVSRLVDRGVGAPTIESVVRILHRLFEVALEEDRVGRNPVRGVRLPAYSRREPRFLDAKEIAAIAREIPNLENVEKAERYVALVYFLAYAGVRVGEASALRVRNLDLTRGIVRVVESSPEVRGRKITGPTKTRRQRVVPMPAFLREMMAEHLEAHGTRGDVDSLVFAGPEGGPIRQNAFRRRVFQPAARAAGITPVPTVHDLRHTAASLMAKAGLSMREAQEILGHSRTTMTDRYTHLFPEETAVKMDALDAIHAEAGEELGKVVDFPGS